MAIKTVRHNRHTDMFMPYRILSTWTFRNGATFTRDRFYEDADYQKKVIGVVYSFFSLPTDSTKFHFRFERHSPRNKHF